MLTETYITEENIHILHIGDILSIKWNSEQGPYFYLVCSTKDLHIKVCSMWEAAENLNTAEMLATLYTEENGFVKLEKCTLIRSL